MTLMSFEWLTMRIGEERERRQREVTILALLPKGLEELHATLADCVATYTAAFGAESAAIQLGGGAIQVTVREKREKGWQPRAQVEVSTVADPPAFLIRRGEESFSIEVGLLPGDKLYYRDSEEYLTVEELTRRILDRALFPKLAE